MRKWVKKHVPQIIACLCCVACMASVLCFGAFAEQEDSESYGGLTLSHTDIPFLSMEFHVAQQMANYGAYRVPLWLSDYRRYEFVIANGDSYRVQFEGDTDGYFVSPYGLTFQWRYTNREELTRNSTTIYYRYTQSLRLSGHDGYIVTKNAQGAEQVREGNFAIEWNVMYVTVEHDIATKYENVMQVAPYREQYYMNDEYLYQTAPLRACQLYYADQGSTTNYIDSLTFDFFLPSNAVGNSWQSGLDIDFRFTSLLDMIDFTSSDLSGTDLSGVRSSAWNFTYLKAVMEETFVPYFDQGFDEGWLIGYSDGEVAGRHVGWEDGYQEGLATAERGGVGTLVSTIMDMIYKIFRSFFAYEVEIGGYNVNIIAWMGVLSVIAIAVIVVKKVFF